MSTSRRRQLALGALCAVVLGLAGLSAGAAGADPASFVQRASAQQLSVTAATGLSVTPASNVTAGNRLVVVTEAWNWGGPTAASVTDTAGNTYTRLLTFKASDKTEMSVWSAPVGAGGGTRPVVTVKPTSTAHMGVSVVEYAGLSSAAGAAVVDKLATGSGTTGTSAATVESGPTGATTGADGLAVGFYVDSGFGVPVSSGTGYTERVNVSPNDIAQVVVEDRVVGAGAIPSASVRTGARTTWLMATVVFKADASGAPQAPAAPTGVSAVAGDGSAAVSWTAPADGGSPLTSHTVTPYINGAAQTPKTVSGSPPATSTTVTGLTNGTAYTFKVTATNAVGTGPASAASSAVTPGAPEPPAAPTAVAAVAGDTTASVSWTAPADGGSPLTSYTITPYAGSTAQAPKTVTGSPPAASTTVTGLTNGTEYTFRVKATNDVGTGPASAPSDPVTPSAPQGPQYVQRVGAEQLSVGLAGLSVTPSSPITAGNRLVVLTEMWNWVGPTASTVTDSAGNTYTRHSSHKAADGTEMSVWSAVVTAGGGTRPSITVRPTSTAHMGVSVVEYSGLSAASGASAVDQLARTSGATGSAAATVASGATAPVSQDGLALGLYVDSGFNRALTADAAYRERVNNSPNDISARLVEDRLVAAGATPNATVRTGSSTTWLMATLVLKAAASGAPQAPGAPAGVTASAGNGRADVSWAAPSDGGSPITSYTVTPYAGGVAQTAKSVSGSPPATQTTVTGLTNGTAYTFKVTATNGVGTGPASPASNAVTPSAPQPPAAPTGVSATAGDASARVDWTAPAGGGITSYTVTPYAGATAQTPKTVTGSPPATSTTVTGLTNGTSYTFRVTATNAEGTGPASAASNAVTPAPSPDGEWSEVLDWPLVAVHTVQLKNGKYLMWDGWTAPQPTSLWDSSNQSFASFTPFSSIFCAGVVQMPDGRVLVAGGHGKSTTGELGIVDTNIFDPVSSTWSRVADMNYPRWYPGLTELADGRSVVISGNTTDASTWADTPEVYDPVTNEWTLLEGVSTPEVHEEEYPFTYLAPSGKVFTIGTEEDLSFLLDVANETWTPVGGKSDIENGSSVMYRPGKVLYSGGAAHLTSIGPARTDASIIDLTDATPDWRPTAPMANRRVYHKLTMLADGKVLALGGQPQSDAGNVTSGVLDAEIWDPATGDWTTVAPAGAARNYHSTSVLMPDGRVLFAGGGHVKSANEAGRKTAQIYSPPYLDRGPRPTITAAPDVASYGTTIPISTPNAASIRSVNLVSLAADTHQIDMSQHFVPLNFTAGAGGLQVDMPASAALAPPASYMIFIVDENGVPSVASFVDVTPALTAPSPPTAVSATSGDAGATVTWTAPPSGGSPITSYKVTPYINGAAQTPKTVSGSPPATSTTVTGLTNETAYTFKVSATNALGTSAASAASQPVTPSAEVRPRFVQRASAQRLSVGTVNGISVTPPSNVTAGNRLVVLTEAWNWAGPTAASVTDSAGNAYTRLVGFKGPDGTELSAWSAPVSAGGGTRPVVTVKPTSTAHMGVSVVEYSGLSTAAGAAVVDQLATATGTAGGSATTVQSGPTAATTEADGLALGFYVDSGFGVALTAGSGYTERVNVSPNDISQMVVEDRVVDAGETPSASVRTGANVTWQMATVVFKGAGAGAGARSAARTAAPSSAPRTARPASPVTFADSAAAAATDSPAARRLRAGLRTRAKRPRGGRDKFAQHLVKTTGSGGGAGWICRLPN